jgi:phosphoribosylformylglycinamidine synthase
VGHLSAAHDVSDGGLAQALVESCLRNGVGARIALPEEFAAGSMPFVFLFSESAGRAMVAVPRGHERAFTGLCAEYGLPWTPIGVTDGQIRALDVRGQFSVGLDELRAAHTGTMPALFGGPDALVVMAVDDFAAADAPAEGEPVGESEPGGDDEPVDDSAPEPSGVAEVDAELAAAAEGDDATPEESADPEAPAQVDEAAETDGELETSSGVAEVDAEIEAEAAPPDYSDGAAKS